MSKLTHAVFCLLTREQLFRSRVYLGHGGSFWNVENCRLVVFSYKASSIIDVIFTVLYFKRALQFIIGIKNKQRWVKILFVNGLPFFNSASDLKRIRRLFFKCPEPYVLRWLPGLLTNLNKVYRRMLINRKRATKVNSNKRLWLWASCLGVRKLKYCIPSLLVFLSVVQHYALCLNEATILRIPTIGIVDTDGYFNNVLYPIVGNDDSFHSCFLYLEIFIKAIRLGSRAAIVQESLAVNEMKLKRKQENNHTTKLKRWKRRLFGDSVLWNLLRKFKLKVVKKYYRLAKYDLFFYYLEKKYSNIFGKRKSRIGLLKVFNFFSFNRAGWRFCIKQL